MCDLSEILTPRASLLFFANRELSCLPQYELLLRIVNQLSKSGKPDWNSMEMPGRTPKALSHQWSRIQKEMSNLDSGNDSGAASTSATSTPKGKKGVAGGFPAKPPLFSFRGHNQLD